MSVIQSNRFDRDKKQKQYNLLSSVCFKQNFNVFRNNIWYLILNSLHSVFKEMKNMNSILQRLLMVKIDL